MCIQGGDSTQEFVEYLIAFSCCCYCCRCTIEGFFVSSLANTIDHVHFCAFDEQNCSEKPVKVLLLLFWFASSVLFAVSCVCIFIGCTMYILYSHPHCQCSCAMRSGCRIMQFSCFIHSFRVFFFSLVRALFNLFRQKFSFHFFRLFCAAHTQIIILFSD